MTKRREIESTEKGWIKAIAEDSQNTEADVRSVLQRFGVKAQTAPPRAKSLRFHSVKIRGTREASENDGEFELIWDKLDAGLWAVMSERNLRGKSSLLNLLHASLRGDFPGRLKPDIWKWLAYVEVVYSIDNVRHKTLLEKDAGEEDHEVTRATISRLNNGNWVELYAGDGAGGLKAETESLMMSELGFTPIFAHNSRTGGHAHGWPLISSALFLSSDSENKALFGDIVMDAIPLRLLQLFIGMPWVSTYSAALTACKFETEQTTQSEGTGLRAALTERLLSVESDLMAARVTAAAEGNRADKRKALTSLDSQIVEARKTATQSRETLEASATTVENVGASFDEARRRLKRLQDEQSAGYSFRKLSPSCCPACEASFTSIVAGPEPVADGSCVLCKNTLPPSGDDVANAHIADAKQQVDALQAALNEAKVAAKTAKAREETDRNHVTSLKIQIDALQDALSQLSAEPEMTVVQLEAKQQQLAEMIAALDTPTVAASQSAAEVDILKSAAEISKALMMTLQEEVLGELSASVMALAQKFGVSNVSSMQLDNGGRLKVHQGGADTFFGKMTVGERLRIKIAIALAAVEVAKSRGFGRHPGLLVIDSPASEEVVTTDFQEMLDSVSAAAEAIGDIQIIIGTIARQAVTAVVPESHRLHAKGDAYLF